VITLGVCLPSLEFALITGRNPGADYSPPLQTHTDSKSTAAHTLSSNTLSALSLSLSLSLHSRSSHPFPEFLRVCSHLAKTNSGVIALLVWLISISVNPGDHQTSGPVLGQLSHEVWCGSYEMSSSTIIVFLPLF